MLHNYLCLVNLKKHNSGLYYLPMMELENILVFRLIIILSWFSSHDLNDYGINYRRIIRNFGRILIENSFNF